MTILADHLGGRLMAAPVRRHLGAWLAATARWRAQADASEPAASAATTIA
jgi:hypothetical protein